MQFAHFSSEPEKLPPPHPALPYDVTAGAPHSAESAPSHGAAPRSLQASHLHHPPHSAALAPFHAIAPVPLHDAGYASSHHAAPAPFHTIAPVPLHGAVCVSTHGAVPAPHHAAKPHAAHSTALGASPPPRHCSRAAGSLETKKLQKRQDFCFRKANYRNRSRFRNEPIAKGKSRDELIAATRRTPHE